MSAVEVGLVVVVVLLAVVVVALARTVSRLTEHVERLERRAARADRAAQRSAPTAPPEEAVMPASESPADDGDAVDVRGVDVHGAAARVDLAGRSAPTVLAFLSTTCGICLGLWRQLRDDGLTDVRAVVVTKDGDVEDLDTARDLADGGALPVVMSSEAWDDYEVPGSPYFLVVGGSPSTVLAEGHADSWHGVQQIAATIEGSR